MSKAKTSPLADTIFQTLHDTQDTAAVALLFSLFRQMPDLLEWLPTVRRNPHASRRLDAVISGKLRPPPPHATGRALLAWIANPATATAAQKSPTSDTLTTATPAPPATTRNRYAGLTRTQIIAHIQSYQSGTIRLAPFLIARAWRHCPPDADPPPALLHATALFLKEAITRNTPNNQDLMRHMTKAVAFFRDTPIGKITRANFGYPNWWKLVLFQYILAHPKPAYTTREFQQHLRSQKLAVENKDIRRFCRIHAIARDMRHGRPKKIT